MPIPNYRVVLSFDPARNVFTARAPELEHCQGEGPTRAEAISRLEEEIQAQVESMLTHGSNPPAAVDDATPPGDLRVKLSNSLHRELLWQARQEGVEVEQLVSELLAAGLAGGRGRGPRPSRGQGAAPSSSASSQPDPNAHDNIGNTVGGGGQKQRGGYGNRGYNPAFLDDRANFIEYVRNLEQGQQPGGAYRGGPGGPGGGGGGPGRNRRRGPGGPGGRGPGNGFGGGSGGGGGRP